MKNVTTFGKLIGLLLFCLPLLFLLSINTYTKKTRNELAHLGMGTIFLVIIIIIIIRLFRIQYKTPIAEAWDYFRNSTLDEIACWKK